VYVFADAVPGTFTVSNANRFGDPSIGLGGIAVTLFVGAQVFATTSTDAQGHFAFAPGVDPQQFYDLKLEGFALQRVYQGVRPADLATTALVLPLDLRTRLDAKLDLLEATNTLVLAYDTAAARTLMSDWNGLQPELAAVHGNRDHALGRLLTAGEGLAGVYADTQPLAMESAKLTVDLVTSALALRKLLSDLSAAATARVATQVAQGTTTHLSASVGLQFLLKGIEIGVTLLQDTIIGGIQSVLPQWGEEQLGHGIDLTTKGVLGAFESGAWSNVAGRGALLGQLVEIIAAEVGGRVVASAYVAQTQADLGLSVLRARTLFGGGTVAQGFVASQGHAGVVALRNADVVSLSQAVGSTAKGWSFAADLFLLIGETSVPGSQLVAAAGTIVKSMSVGGLVVAGVNDYTTAFVTAFDDAPLVASLAFMPDQSRPGIAGANTVLRASAVLNVIPADYSTRLAALKDRVNVNDRPGAIVAAQALLAGEAELEAAVEAELLRLMALTASNDVVALAIAQRATLASAGALGAERMSVYGLLAGYVIPELAPAGAVDSDLLARIDLVSAAIGAFESAVVDAEDAASGLSSQGFVVVPEHGLVQGGSFGETAPGAIAIRARLVNAGQQAAQGVVVGLAFGVDAIPVQVAVLTSAPLQALGTLAPGEARMLTWDAVATDVSAAGTGSAATYEILLTASAGDTTNAFGGIEVLSSLDPMFRDGFEQ
jgi:hypothetical protein